MYGVFWGLGLSIPIQHHTVDSLKLVDEAEIKGPERYGGGGFLGKSLQSQGG